MYALYLGYPECDESMVDLMINNPDIIVSSKQGIRETYGLREQPEFCYYKNRKHKEFSLKSIIGDILFAEMSCLYKHCFTIRNLEKKYIT